MKLSIALFCLIIFLSVPEATARGSFSPGRIIGSIGRVVPRIISGFSGFFGGGGDGDDDEKKKRFAEAPVDLYTEADRITAKEMHAKCRHNNFEVKLGVIKAHVVLIFVPQEAPQSNCSNHFLFHSWEVNPIDGQMGVFQEFTPFEIQSKDLAILKVGQVHGSHLGSSIFSEALPDHKTYDTIDSNCGHKIIHLLEKLEIPITYGIGNFVVENLIKSATFMKGLRQHQSLPKVFPSATAPEIQQMTDRALADGLVHYTLAKEYTLYQSQDDSYKTATIVLASILGCIGAFMLVALAVHVLRTPSHGEKC